MLVSRFFTDNSDTILYYQHRRFFCLVAIMTVLHLWVLFTVDFHPLIEVIKQITDSQQRAVSLTLEKSSSPEEAKFIGLVEHRGPLETQANAPSQEQRLLTMPETADEAHYVNILSETANESSPVSKTLLKPYELSSLPRKKVISAATHHHEDAAYLYRWQQYIEAVGSELYPKEAMRKNITGKLRLLVALDKKGMVQDVSILKSSGVTILDKAAIEIVKKAQPFEPVPSEMMAHHESIEIIRTWEFRGIQGLKVPA